MERENFPQYYTILFNGIADALKALDQQETSRAWDILVRIQQEAEDAYIRAEETSIKAGRGGCPALRRFTGLSAARWPR